MKELILFSSKECCLCDDAIDLMARSACQKRFTVKKVDIYTDKQLLVKYRTKIPVVKDSSAQAELGWPFDQSRFENWFKSL